MTKYSNFIPLLLKYFPNLNLTIREMLVILYAYFLKNFENVSIASPVNLAKYMNIDEDQISETLESLYERNLIKILKKKNGQYYLSFDKVLHDLQQQYLDNKESKLWEANLINNTNDSLTIDDTFDNNQVSEKLSGLKKKKRVLWINNNHSSNNDY